jgi:UDP-N-acetyl-D-galactosamine dehydrogenase
MVAALRDFGLQVDVHDPWADPAEALAEYALVLTPKPAEGHYDALVLAVAHRQFVELGAAGLRRFGQANAVCFDIKSVLPREAVDDRL